MKKVTLITRVQTQEVTYLGQKEMEFARMMPLHSVKSGDGGMLVDKMVNREMAPVVPLSHIIAEHGREWVRKDTYICMSPEVEELIGVPFNTIHRELKLARNVSEQRRRMIDALSTEAANIRNRLDTRWKRLKFVWRGFRA